MIRFLVLIVLAVGLALPQPGCSVGFKTEANVEAFYPDKLAGKDKDVGDPRGPKYGPGTIGQFEDYKGGFRPFGEGGGR